jgi:hypothetical protein
MYLPKSNETSNVECEDCVWKLSSRGWVLNRRSVPRWCGARGNFKPHSQSPHVRNFLLDSRAQRHQRYEPSITNDNTFLASLSQLASLPLTSPNPNFLPTARKNESCPTLEDIANTSLRTVAKVGNPLLHL